jgi:uracil-DNA glycosylase family 4
MFIPLTVLSTKPPTSTVPKCGKCQLYKTCDSPKMEPSGKGRKGILIVGEAPGQDEDEQGIQFVGKTGRVLQRVLSEINVDLRRDCWTTNALICRPPGNDVGDRKRIAYCRPNLLATIKKLNPKVIILLGQVPTESFIGHFWKEKIGGIKRWAGWRIPHQYTNTWICPTFHPSYVSRMDDKVVNTIWKQHLESACSLEHRPWKATPDYDRRIEIILDDEEAARRLDKIKDGIIAFDFENDRLKPDHKKAEIITCSVAYKGKCIAFPWFGKVIPAMERLLRNPKVHKIASNLKHEERWCIKVLGYEVRGWYWDTMIGAHALDSRGKISSIKFQAFVRLGSEDYDSFIKPYMETKGGNERNRVKDIDLRTLLRYNALDSLLEYFVAAKQCKEIGWSEK